MGKPLEISDMPPLTPEMHGDLRALENRLRLALSKCCSGYDLIDSHAAFEYTRTYATEFFDCFYCFYSGIRDEKYRPHWRPASETFAFDRVVHCIENNHAVLSFFRSDANRVERIKRTITDHAGRNSLPQKFSDVLTGKQASAFARAGIDLTSASPLLEMLHTATQANRTDEQQPRRGSRETVVLPLLETKGWSVLDWATHSDVAYHTAADYLAGKRTPYRSTRKKLAESIGLTVQQLPQ